jgi:hypothetical protein
MEQYSLTEEIVKYDRSRRLSYKEDGDWPHPNHYGFHEAVAAAHFILRGYHVLTDYSTTYPKTSRLVKRHYSTIFREIVGQEITDFMQKLRRRYGVDSGQPDLFVFREETPNDPKIKFRDPRLWFFVETKGPNEGIRKTQKEYWRAIAEREDIALGPHRIRLFRVVPDDYKGEPKTFYY